jgi:acid phosphatase
MYQGCILPDRADSSNVSSIVDLLEDKGVSWGAYLESMPYTGYTAESADKLYYRKHNPLVSPISVSVAYDDRLVIKALLQMIHGWRISKT